MYDAYVRCIRAALTAGDLTRFKSNPEYQAILEHVSPELGAAYLELLRTGGVKITEEMIREFCERNDSVGGPAKASYSTGGAETQPLICSPTSLRYLYHAHLALSHFAEISSKGGAPAAQPISIVEVGAGYGGLCLAIQMLAPVYGVVVKSYTLVDLPAASALQRAVLERVAPVPAFPLQFLDATPFGADVAGEGHFLISNYCYSELPAEFRAEYRRNLFPKIAHGFLTWNFIPLEDFGFPQARVEEEVPKTGRWNKYILF